MTTEPVRLGQRVLVEATVDELPTNGTVDRYYRLVIPGVVGGVATIGVRAEDLSGFVVTGTTDEMVTLRAERNQYLSMLAEIGDIISPTGERPEEALGTLVRDVLALSNDYERLLP